jgi:hypothetical protein
LVCYFAVHAKRLQDIVNLYLRAGFVVQAAVMDNEFEKIKTQLLPVCEVNTTAKNEHVGEIERNIQHVKGRLRSVKATLTTIEFWYSILTIIILIGIQSGHNYCRNTVGL